MAILNSFSGLGSSRRHLQAGGSLSGSLRGINSDIMTIPRAPLPPTSVNEKNKFIKLFSQFIQKCVILVKI
ncbi:hypothetical protein Bhyg_10623 [Pseudolycoriella hygida]|uniref:Uncharacterized protein n=1 Tax=Pseudolycoriella hygida TaxID=35572 RepID=A0A9Q0RYW3_9DIPT|nr:hypothetical protein Bhyg_10623 [Pseudolycoriella hygida]